MTSIIITMADIRKAKLCSRGAREWFALNGLDFNKFLSDGIQLEVAENFDCELSRQVCAVAREREKNERL